MKETMFTVSSENMSNKEAWQEWGRILDQSGVVIYNRHNQYTPLKASMHSFSDDETEINILTRIIPLSWDETITKVARPKYNERGEPNNPLALLFARECSFQVEQDGRTLDVPQGQLLLLNETKPYTLQSHSGTLAVSLFKSTCQNDNKSNDEKQKIQSQVISQDLPTGRILASTIAAFSVQSLRRFPLSGSALTDMVCSMLCLYLNRPTQNNDHHTPELLKKIKAMIEARYDDAALSPQTVAQAIGISQRTFYLALQKSELQFYDLLFDTRIKRAINLLENRLLDGHSIAEIAYQVGFTNVSHFSTTFKKRTGLTPTDYRIRVKARK